METKYFVAYDGNPRGMFDTLEQAEHYILKQTGWTDEKIAEDWDFVKSQCAKYGGDPFSNDDRPSLWFITELKFSDGQIAEVDGRPFDDYIEEISAERGTEEFEQTKLRMVGYFLMKASRKNQKTK